MIKAFCSTIITIVVALVILFIVAYMKARIKGDTEEFWRTLFEDDY